MSSRCGPRLVESPFEVAREPLVQLFARDGAALVREPAGLEPERAGEPREGGREQLEGMPSRGRELGPERCDLLGPGFHGIA